MAQPMNTQIYFEEMSKSGAFASLIGFVNSGAIAREHAPGILAKLFDVYLLYAREAQTEVRCIDAVLSRLIAVCQEGKHPRPWVERDPRVLKLAQELTTLDGWVMSLYEFEITMITIGNPERGKAKPQELAVAMNRLWEKKMSELNLRA